MKHVSMLPRVTLLFLGVLIGSAAVFWLWPQAALADDCLRDPFDAEDCLRTSFWAPVIAGVTGALTGLFVSLGEIKNTLAVMADRAADKVSQGVASAADTMGNWADEILEDGSRAWGEVKPGAAAAVETFGADVELVSNEAGHKVPGYQEITEKINQAIGNEQIAKDNRRRIKIAKSGIKGVRLTFAGLGAALWAIPAYFAGMSLWPAVVIGGIAYYLPDAAGMVEDFMLDEKGLKLKRARQALEKQKAKRRGE